jgi:hypothetical protein
MGTMETVKWATKISLLKYINNIKRNKNAKCSVHIIAQSTRNLSLHYSVQTASGGHPVSYPMGTWGLFPRE